METLITFLPMAVYLATVWGFQLQRKQVPLFVHLAAILAGSAVLGILIAWYAPLISLTVGGLFFLLSVLIAGKHATRTTLYTISTSLAISPPVVGWIAVGVGLAFASLVSFVKITRKMGKDRAMFTMYESASSLGVSGGIIPNPDLERIPAPKLDDSESVSKSAGRMRLAPWILLGVIVTALAYVLFF